jgi:hypothetical protein
MCIQYNIRIKDTTTPQDLDSMFTHAWSYKKPVRFVMDVTECKNVSLGRILSMKGVLDHHRPNSRKYIDYTTIIVKSRLAKTLLSLGLSIIKTERPVKISTPT